MDCNDIYKVVGTIMSAYIVVALLGMFVCSIVVMIATGWFDRKRVDDSGIVRKIARSQKSPEDKPAPLEDGEEVEGEYPGDVVISGIRTVVRENPKKWSASGRTWSSVPVLPDDAELYVVPRQSYQLPDGTTAEYIRSWDSFGNMHDVFMLPVGTRDYEMPTDGAVVLQRDCYVRKCDPSGWNAWTHTTLPISFDANTWTMVTSRRGVAILYSAESTYIMDIDGEWHSETVRVMPGATACTLGGSIIIISISGSVLWRLYPNGNRLVKMWCASDWNGAGNPTVLRTSPNGSVLMWSPPYAAILRGDRFYPKFVQKPLRDRMLSPVAWDGDHIRTIDKHRANRVCAYRVTEESFEHSK